MNLGGFLVVVLCLVPPVRGALPAEWTPHAVRQGDGKGGWIERSGESLFLRHPGGEYTYPFGVLPMDNGEIILIAGWDDGVASNPVVAFSKDGGETWSDFEIIPNTAGRPMLLTDLGRGHLLFLADPLGHGLMREYFSSDYGHSWPESQTLQKTANGGVRNNGGKDEGFMGVEGNAMVDREPDGRAARIAMIGWNFEKGKQVPWPPAAGGILRWSRDGGRTWFDETVPRAWRPIDFEHRGKTFKGGLSEGSIVRAANGWLVAALRTDMPPRYFDELDKNNDWLEGTACSISKDNGGSWSPRRCLYDAGRHHADLRNLPNGDLLMTLIVRNDIDPGAMRRASDRQGCEAVLSHDNGLTWDLAHKYTIGAFDAPVPASAAWWKGACGHLASCVLKDGSVLTVYGNYVKQGIVMVHWKP